MVLRRYHRQLCTTGDVSPLLTVGPATTTSTALRLTQQHLTTFWRGLHSAHLLRDLDATADLPNHCSLFALQLLDLTHRWWSEFEDPDIEEGDVYFLAAALHTAQAVHEVVVEEYRILDSENFELATYSLADWVRFFETRFSLSVAALPTGDWLTTFTVGARPFQGSRKFGLVSGK